MDQFKAGDIIEHRLMPGFTMPVQETRDCETDGSLPSRTWPTGSLTRRGTRTGCATWTCNSRARTSRGPDDRAPSTTARP